MSWFSFGTQLHRRVWVFFPLSSGRSTGDGSLMSFQLLLFKINIKMLKSVLNFEESTSHGFWIVFIMYCNLCKHVCSMDSVKLGAVWCPFTSFLPFGPSHSTEEILLSPVGWSFIWYSHWTCSLRGNNSMSKTSPLVVTKTALTHVELNTVKMWFLISLCRKTDAFLWLLKFHNILILVLLSILTNTNHRPATSNSTFSHKSARETAREILPWYRMTWQTTKTEEKDCLC